MKNLRDELNIELPRAKGAYLGEAPEKIWTEDGWVLEEKADGTRESLQIGSDRSLLVGRNRENFLKGVENAGNFMLHSHPIFSNICCHELDGTILDGELTLHFTQDGEPDETTRVRISEGVFAGYTVWQALFVNGQDLRTRSDAERRQAAKEVIERLNEPLIRLIDRYPATLGRLKEIQDSGAEGAVAKLTTAPLVLGQRTCPTWWKLKGQNSVDVFITGVTEGKEGGSGIRGIKPRPNGKAASFTVSMFGAPNKRLNRALTIMPVAKVKHLPDDVQEDGFRNFSKYKGKVMEIKVSGWNGKSFRWARFIRWRDDKTAMDCKFSEQVSGN